MENWHLVEFPGLPFVIISIPEVAGTPVAVSTEQTQCWFVIWEAACVNDDTSKCWFIWSSCGFYLFQGKMLTLRMAEAIALQIPQVAGTSLEESGVYKHGFHLGRHILILTLLT